METGDVWLGLIAFAPFALLGFAFLYLPVGAFILAAKGARISWRDLLLGALVLSGALYAGVAVGGLAYLQGPTDGGVYSALILAILGAGVAVYFVSLFGTARGGAGRKLSHPHSKQRASALLYGNRFRRRHRRRAVRRVVVGVHVVRRRDGDHYFLHLRGAILHAAKQIRFDELPILRLGRRAHCLGRISPDLGCN